jgi:hypothetical protein
MSSTIMDFRVREEMAGAVLKEVAALEPAERVQEAESLMQIMVQAVRGLEELWADLRDPLERGVSPSQAAVLGRILTRSANLIGIALELLGRESPSLEDFRIANMASLQHIKGYAASLRRLAEMPAPAPDPERLRRSLEQMERGEGIDGGDLLAELRA